MFLHSLVAILASAVAVTATSAAAYKYPSIINDTSARDVPFFLAVSEVKTAAYANKNVQLGYNGSSHSDIGVFINPTDVVAEFVLKNGSFQIPTSPPLYASLQPLGTENGIIRHILLFTSNSSATSGDWELVNVSNDGVFGLLSNHGRFDRFNGFVICSTTKNHFQIEYQSSKDGKNTPGCEGMALHAYMGPPY